MNFDQQQLENAVSEYESQDLNTTFRSLTNDQAVVVPRDDEQQVSSYLQDLSQHFVDPETSFGTSGIEIEELEPIDQCLRRLANEYTEEARPAHQMRKVA